MKNSRLIIGIGVVLAASTLGANCDIPRRTWNPPPGSSGAGSTSTGTTTPPTSNPAPCSSLASLPSAPPGTSSFDTQTNIRFEDVDAVRVCAQDISVNRSGGGTCDYRLEFDNPSHHPEWAIHEVGGDQGARQRYSTTSCSGAEFTAVASDAVHPHHFEEQTMYYWVMEARRYASRRLWVSPADWSGPPISFSTKRLDPYILSDEGFNTSCWPNPLGGCMRAFPTEGPRIYIREGRISPTLVAHEYGHYAAGYVFGHMDTFKYEFAKCGKRAFQEAIAEMFKSLMMHDLRYDYFVAKDPVANGVPRSAFSLASTSVWSGECGEGDYTMGRPLVQSFHKLLWDGVWGDDHDRANRVLAAAFASALAKNKGHRLEELSSDLLEALDKEPAVRSRAVEIFGTHGFKGVGSACGGNIECAGARTSRCDTTKSTRRCIPDDGEGIDGDYCSHDNHCRSQHCVGAGGNLGGKCQDGNGIGESCAENSDCAADRTTRCDQTASPKKCIPNDGTGVIGDYCTHNRQCNGASGLTCRVLPGPSPQPGQCAR